ncbi:MAG: hypothetical protein K0S53_2206 [Bacteroidetes bacterium]|jgi:hypothetical protein|nr:hypothetical protein [Bacteroidota bacterium]
MENQKEQAILNGRFKLITEFNEMRASQWVRGFGINDANGNEVLPLMSSFDLDGFEETGDILKVKFKIFPNGLKQYAVEIDPVNRRFAYEGNTFALDRFEETFKK